MNNKQKLLEIIDRFNEVPLLVVGDLILDHYIWGKVKRISPEAPVVVVHVTEENKRPGGAGNVVNNLVSLGARPSICGIVGDDDWGRELLGCLEAHGVDTSGVLVDRTRPTIVKTRVIAHAQQVVRVDREDLRPFDPSYREGVAAAFESKLSSAKAVVISDYAKGVVSPEIFKRIEKGYASGILGAGKIPVVVDPKAPNFSFYSHATVIKPNRAEAEEASGMSIPDRKAALDVGRQLLQRWGSEMVLITLGEDGMVLVSQVPGDIPHVEIATEASEVYDVSGAGDTVSAVFTLALAVGATPGQAARLANYAAGVVVKEVGTVAISAEELRQAVSEGAQE